MKQRGPNIESDEEINFGGFIVSLDFELHWGVRDKRSTNGDYRKNLLGARKAIPKILQLFQKYNISATWGIVGFLFAKSREELNGFKNKIPEPEYKNQVYNSFQEKVGKNENQDPFHFAPKIIREIKSSHRQEIASHTTSHFYPLEPGQTQKEFEADLNRFIKIADSWGIDIESLIYPRNQHNPRYTDTLTNTNIKCFRGNPNVWIYRGTTNDQKNTLTKRILRFLDAYFNLFGHKTYPWRNLRYTKNLLNIRASSFLRPYSKNLSFLEEQKINRIKSSMTYAAQNNNLYHLYWHPHNFGKNTKKNLLNLNRILSHFKYLQKTYNMKSLSMKKVTQIYNEKINKSNH